MAYKVCIPTAGTGSRLEGLTRHINKSLVSINNRPSICYILEKFPSDAKIVIALGYKGDLVREFLELAYPNRKFDYVKVELFEGEGSGLGLSLLACEQFLQEPFVFSSCDTLIDGVIPPPDMNWMGYADLDNPIQYRTLEIEGDLVVQIADKNLQKNKRHKPYIGLAGIFDYEKFWSEMRQGGSEAIQQGESYGLKMILPDRILAKPFKWHDTGNFDALNLAKEYYRTPNEYNILEKENEAIWFIGKDVIKYSNDKGFIANRVVRAKELGAFIPKITGTGLNMYRYEKVSGRVLSEVINLPLFSKLLEHSSEFWTTKHLNANDRDQFKKVCAKFYRDKTYERVDLFYKNFSKKDQEDIINGIRTSTLKDMLDSIDWGLLANGSPGRFHGDFHFENIIWSESEKKFTFIDWRQDFGGILNIGDIYYDLAKLMHGLIINHEIIAKDLYQVNWVNEDIKYDFNRKHILVECEKSFTYWIKKNGYDIKKVRLLTALIFLNIAALHHYPYSLLLFGLGKSMLNDILRLR